MKTSGANLEYETLYGDLGYTFRNKALVVQAFRHSSYVNEQVGADLEDNERLEFLGDAVLDLAVSHLLMERNSQANEGELSRFRSMVVDEAGLHDVATRLNLGSYLLLGKGEDQSLGREKPSILADVTEALIGAIYLDGGFDVVKEFIENLFAPFWKNWGPRIWFRIIRVFFRNLPNRLSKVFPNTVSWKKRGLRTIRSFASPWPSTALFWPREKGKSKKEAEQHAAKEAFFRLKEE
jgi:ribonuclease-3